MTNKKRRNFLCLCRILQLNYVFSVMHIALMRSPPRKQNCAP